MSRPPTPDSDPRLDPTPDQDPVRTVVPPPEIEPRAVDARPATLAIGGLLLLSAILFVLVPFLAGRGNVGALAAAPVTSEARSREVAIARETLRSGHHQLATGVLIELWEDPRILGRDRHEVRRLLVSALEETLTDTTDLSPGRCHGYRRLLRDLRPVALDRKLHPGGVRSPRPARLPS